MMDKNPSKDGRGTTLFVSAIGKRQLPIFRLSAMVAATMLLMACSGGGGSENTSSLNNNLRTTDTSSSPPPASSDASTTTSTNVSAAMSHGYLTVPSGLRAGQVATIEGHGYTPQKSYFLTIHDPAGGVSTQNVNVGTDGNFQFQLSLPQSGTYQATAVDNGTGTEVGKVIVSAAPMD